MASKTNDSIIKETRPDGSILIRSTIPLEPTPHRLTERLAHWAKVRPNKIFLAQPGRSKTSWETLTYSEAFEKVKCIAQSLLDRDLSDDKPVVILSGNSIEHALMAMACLHVGIPFSAISPAYSLRSVEFDRLKHIVRLLTPGLIFVNDALQFEKALKAVAGDINVVSCVPPQSNFNFTSIDDLLKTKVTDSVALAHQAIKPESVAKILFTSGSTGLPKGVMNTHENITVNLQQINQTFPFFRDEDLEMVDWLPWNHTFGGNHNFGIALYNGGTLYIDDGNPTPEGIQRTVHNLKERTPTTYFNVPKGFEMLLPFLRNDDELRKRFFSNLKMLFYAGAGISQHVWDALEELCLATTGKMVLFGAGLGSTESCPSALFSSKPGGFSGLVGVPVDGLELKLVAKKGKLEARYRGKNIFPGYWRQPELTERAFDDEGFYRTGDALVFVDEHDPSKGMIFNGRITEDFKLNTGTWVSVSTIKAHLIAEGKGLIHEAAITGHDGEFIGAIIFPDLNYCKSKLGITDVSPESLASNAVILKALHDVLAQLAAKSTGSSTWIRRAVVADFTPSLDKGEVTDKGSVNQWMVLNNHREVVERLYSENGADGVVEVG